MVAKYGLIKVKKGHVLSGSNPPVRVIIEAVRKIIEAIRLFVEAVRVLVEG
jgi:hypothetical protein